MTAIALETLVTIFGGSGFLGRHVVRALARLGYRIRVAVRRPELAGHLQPLGRVGQIHAVQANLRYPASVAAAMRDSEVAINLVGILTESGKQTFEAVQAAGAAIVAKAPAATIMRPSVVFGPEDQFTNRFAGLARLSPALPLIGGGTTKLQPVYVGDV